MIIPRIKCFDDAEKKSDKSEIAKTVAGAGIGAGAVYGFKKTVPINHKLANDLSSTGKIGSDKLRKELLKNAKKQGIRVVKDPEFGNSAYVGTSGGKMVRNWAAKLKKVGRKLKNRQFIQSAEDIKSGLAEKVGRKGMENLGKDVVILGGNSKEKGLGSTAVLSHELGHAQYMKKGRSKNILVKGAHKLMPISAMALNTKPGVFAAGGFINGVRSAKMKHEGKKESTWHKIGAAAVPAALVAPLLVAEGGASMKGLKLLKKAGADKAALKGARKQLGKAWGTYATAAARPILSGIAGREAGKLAGKAYYKIKDQEEDDNTKK